MVTQGMFQPYFNFIAGAGISIEVDANPDDGDNEITISATGGGGSHLIEDEGSPLTARTSLNFVGAGVAVTDDAGNDRSIITITEPAAVTAQSTADNHIADAAGAHAASTISVDSTALTGTSVTVQGSLEEIDNVADSALANAATAQTTADNHVSDAAAAHAGSAISIDSTTLVGAADDVQEEIELLDNAIVALQTFSVGALFTTNVAGIYPIWVAPFACTVTAVRAYVDTGTTTVVNAGTTAAGTENFCSADITIDPADAWEPGTVDQNQAVAAGETLSLEIVTAGTATQVNIQVDLTRP